MVLISTQTAKQEDRSQMDWQRRCYTGLSMWGIISAVGLMSTRTWLSIWKKLITLKNWPQITGSYSAILKLAKAFETHRFRPEKRDFDYLCLHPASVKSTRNDWLVLNDPQTVETIESNAKTPLF
jgi:hypothetical protein